MAYFDLINIMFGSSLVIRYSMQV